MTVVSFLDRYREALPALLDPGVRLITVDPSDADAVALTLPEAQILISPQFDARLAAMSRGLKAILCPAAGTEGIDRNALPSGVEVVNGVGHEIPMAEYVIGALVALRQRFGQADAGLRGGEWRFGYFGSVAYVDECFGSTLGLVGFGRIGAEVARRARAFGMRVRAVTLHPDKPIETGLLDGGPGRLDSVPDVDAMVEASDAIVIAVELSDITRGLFDAARLARMRPSAVLVNVARGPIVDERALYECLRDGRIAGAALDVWYSYPAARGERAKPSALPFEALDNILMTPHSSGWTAAAARRKLEFLAREINRRASG